MTPSDSKKHSTIDSSTYTSSRKMREKWLAAQDYSNTDNWPLNGKLN